MQKTVIYMQELRRILYIAVIVYALIAHRIPEVWAAPACGKCQSDDPVKRAPQKEFSRCSAANIVPTVRAVYNVMLLIVTEEYCLGYIYGQATGRLYIGD